jgi:hypothetical protein
MPLSKWVAPGLRVSAAAGESSAAAGESSAATGESSAATAGARGLLKSPLSLRARIYPCRKSRGINWALGSV